MNTLIGALLLLVPSAAGQKPVPKESVGTETTFVTGPIDQDGYVDYEAALNERLRKTTSSQTNANVLLYKALGPQPAGVPLPPEFFKHLGMGELPAKGDYFVGLNKYLCDYLKLQPNERRQTVYDQQSRATRRLWTMQDYPDIGAWLILNEKALTVVVEATRRPHYYHPLVAARDSDGRRGPLIGAQPSSIQRCRELTVALTARAMFRLAEGKDDEAWQDLLAGHRLAALVASGASLIESLVGVAIDSIVSRADLAYLERAKLTTKQLRDRLNVLQSLAPITPIAGKMDLGERFEYLDSLQAVRRGRFNVLNDLVIFDPTEKLEPKPQDERLLADVDWTQAYRDGNKWFDRAVAILKIKDRAERGRQLDRMDDDLNAIRIDVASVKMRLAKLQTAGAEPDKLFGKAVGDMFLGLYMNFRNIQNAVERSEQMRSNVQIAFALAAYRLDNKRYPAKLADLSPKYLATVPLDKFTGKPLTYRAAEKGYLFYSFGPNGKDDDGRGRDEEPPGDDLGVRMPLPAVR